MTPAELDERRKGAIAGILKSPSTSLPAECAKVEALFLIAIELATLNAKLEPARLVSAIEEIQAELEKREKRPR